MTQMRTALAARDVLDMPLEGRSLMSSHSVSESVLRLLPWLRAEEFGTNQQAMKGKNERLIEIKCCLYLFDT